MKKLKREYIKAQRSQNASYIVTSTESCKKYRQTCKQGYEKGERLCLSCDCTLYMMFGLPYFYEKYKSQDLKQSTFPYTYPCV